MSHYHFTSEAVADGHPDKVADQISDTILDACLEQDPHSMVACEALVTTGLVILAGEITSKARVEYDTIVRHTIRDIGYTDPKAGFDYRSCGILTAIHEQSPDIARGVNELEGTNENQGAGDQGLMFGFACDETPELMPLPLMLSHRILGTLKEKRLSGELPYLRPDGKSQVTIEYEEGSHRPLRVEAVVVSTQHAEEVPLSTIEMDVRKIIQEVTGKQLLDKDTKYYINPTGRFVIGGPMGDSGVTGRKLMVDTYGGMARHGGGAFSGKDPSKVDRSAAYACRYAAKNLVAAKLARRCEIQVSYAIGIARPMSIFVNSFGTGTLPDEVLATLVEEIFDFRPWAIIDKLQLRRPIYRATASGGHFGRLEKQFTWEKTDQVEALRRAAARFAHVSNART